jgi:flagellar protein FlaI
MTPDMAALLWQAMQYEMNVLVAGGTASGKTSALNGLVALVQPFQRILTIEDTRELMLPTYQWNWIPMITRLPNPEGLGEVTMLDLLVNALRMRPDRIVMGEIRRKREAEVLFEAMHTGHSVYSTMHADTSGRRTATWRSSTSTPASPRARRWRTRRASLQYSPGWKRTGWRT